MLVKLCSTVDTSIKTLFRVADNDGSALGYPDAPRQEIRLQRHIEGEHFHFLGRDLPHDNTTTLGRLSWEED